MASSELVSRRISETVVASKRLGRHVLHDPRSRDFPAPRAPSIVSVTHVATGLPLDQGNIGSCTANALCGALDSAPEDSSGKVYDEAQAVQLYEAETNRLRRRRRTAWRSNVSGPLPPTPRRRCSSKSSSRRWRSSPITSR
jgi:hypothetical protein